MYQQQRNCHCRHCYPYGTKDKGCGIDVQNSSPGKKQKVRDKKTAEEKEVQAYYLSG